jgi:hypothetical protein
MWSSCGYERALARRGPTEETRTAGRYAAAGRGGASAPDGPLEARSLAGEPVHLCPA